MIPQRPYDPDPDDVARFESLPDLSLRGVSWGRRTYDSGRVTYVVRFYDQSKRPKQKQAALTAGVQGAAQAEAFQMGQRWHLGLFDPWETKPDDASLRAAARAWMASGGPDGADWSRATHRGRNGVLDLFLADHGHRSVRDVSPEDVRAFVYAPRLKVGSQRSYYTVLHTFFRWCRANGYASHVPTDDVPKPQSRGRARLRYFTPAELERFCEAAEAYYADQGHVFDRAGRGHFVWIADFVRFAVATGLRKGELRHLRWCDVDLDLRRVYVRSYEGKWQGKKFSFSTKWDSDREVPLSRSAEAVLKRRVRRSESDVEPVFLGPHGSILGSSQVNRAFCKARELAGLPDALDVHACRHTFASWLLTAGVSVYHVSQWLGHASIRTTADTYGALLKVDASIIDEVFA